MFNEKKYVLNFDNYKSYVLLMVLGAFKLKGIDYLITTYGPPTLTFEYYSFGLGLTHANNFIEWYIRIS